MLLVLGIVLSFVFDPTSPWPMLVRVGHVLAWSLPSVAALRGQRATSMLVPSALISLALCVLAAQTGALFAMF